ncbi:hypothetical protein [Photobacterium minamisatsumaniensis]|uniref:hypothetical protein n=1 Tax=Photobacterium minamisatsumaniensis TaxID=2910233 RepID=UPI003D0BE336
MKAIHGLMLLAGTLALSGCELENDKKKSLSENEIKKYISASNINPSYVGMAPRQNTRTVRFDTTSQIPIYYVVNGGGSVPKEILSGVQNLENLLGNVFGDFQVIDDDLSMYRDESKPGNQPDYSHSIEDFYNRHGIDYGLIFSVGTAFWDPAMESKPGSMCANAGQAPYNGGLYVRYDEVSGYYSDTHKAWVNLGNGSCSWDTDIVKHEIAHNLGLFNHFSPYFGKWSQGAEQVLRNLYSNPANLSPDDMVITR